MGELAIQLRGLTKHYGKARGVIDLDLDVGTGEVFGYLGPNGAGKSTTIRLLLDLIRPSSGSATVLGHDARGETLQVRRRVGYLPGELSLYESFTPNEALDYFAELRGGVDSAYRAELVDRLEVDDSRRIGDLSTGNKQKVGIVQAFMHRPELLILDEPTSGLDPLMQIAVYEMIEEVRAEGRTVFLSSHVLPEVERIADRVGIIREGRLVEVATVDSLKERAVRVVEVRFGDSSPTPDALQELPGVLRVERSRNIVQLRIEGSMDGLIKALADYEVLSLHSHEADLEEIFLDLYRGADA